MGGKPGDDLDDHVSKVDPKPDAKGFAHGIGRDVMMMAMIVVAVVMLVMIVVLVHDRVIHAGGWRWQRVSGEAAIEPAQIPNRRMRGGHMLGGQVINFERRLHVIRGGQGFGGIFYSTASNSVFWSSSRWR
jgi:hypothetical protein